MIFCALSVIVTPFGVIALVTTIRVYRRPDQLGEFAREVEREIGSDDEWAIAACPVTPSHLGQLVRLIDDGTISAEGKARVVIAAGSDFEQLAYQSDDQYVVEVKPPVKAKRRTIYWRSNAAE